jgi:O-antigen/teichoic acid export membrane protein
LIAKFFSSSIINLGLRGLSMIAKFLLVIYIGKYLSVEELGEYGLFVITVTIAIYFLGFDFYTYTAREIIAQEKSKRLKFIRDQFIFHMIVYVIILPLLLTVFFLGIIRTEFILYFYIILVFEHLSQELYRLYTTLQKPIFANFLLFLRTGVWVYVVIALWQLNLEDTMNLQSVWYGWAIGSLISIIIGIVYLKKDYDFKSVIEKIDWLWIKKGIKVSTPFFIGTLAYKVIEFSDRYMIDYYMTKTDVGIYTFFSGISNTINTIVFTLVIMIYYPLLVEQYQNKQMNVFKKTLKVFSFKTITVSIVSAIVILLFIGFILNFMGKIGFQENIEVLWVLIISNIILNISFISHYVLYAAQKDIVIRNATLVGAGMNIVLNLILIKSYGLN